MNKLIKINFYFKYLLEKAGFKSCLFFIFKYYSFFENKKYFVLSKRKLQKQINALLNDIYLENQIGTCVSVSLTIFLKLLLSRNKPIIKIGLIKDEEKPISHMWVESNNFKFKTSLNEEIDFQIIDSIDFNKIKELFVYDIIDRKQKRK